MKLINSDTLNNTIEESIERFGRIYSDDLINGLMMCMQIIKEQPDIIRCKNCKQWEMFGDEFEGWCDELARVTMYDYYCNWAEEKKDGTR